MGLEHTKVLPVKDHLNEFTCVLCMKIVSLNAVVTPCHHTFCKGCFDHFVDCQGVNCPSCSAKIVEPDGSVRAKPLEQAQPLAFRILGRIKVVCVHRNLSSNCSWSGNYCDLEQHIATYHASEEDENERSSSDLALRPPPPPMSHSVSLSFMPMQPLAPPRLRQNKSDHFGSLPPIVSSGGHPLERAKSAPRHRPAKSSPRHREGSTERFAAARDVPTLSLSQSSFSDTHGVSDRQLWKGRRSQLRKSRSSTPKKKSTAPRSPRLTGPQGNENNTAAAHMMKSRSEARSESPASELRHFPTFAPIAKENGNAAFKAKNYHEAVVLYSEGIAAYKALRYPTEEDRALVSSLYGNRAAAYLKSKRFDQCIRDSDRALKMNKHLTKVCLRKAWALIELGRLDDACDTLSESLANNPGSKDLQFELFETKKLVQQRLIPVV